jgi:pyruvate dehydrogenase E1 component alpha subunit
VTFTGTGDGGPVEATSRSDEFCRGAQTPRRALLQQQSIRLFNAATSADGDPRRGRPGESLWDAWRDRGWNDLAAVYVASRRAIARARNGEGPTFLEFKTMRMHGHSEHDPAKYVPRELLEEWKKKIQS